MVFNSLEDLEQIEVILLEASAYGLRYEVEEAAKKNQLEISNISIVESYVLAFDEYIK